MKCLSTGFWSVLLVASGILILTSCGNGELTKGAAEKALKKGELMFQDNSQCAKLSLGYYEIDNEREQEMLFGLLNAGLITYKESVITEVRKYYADKNHLFAHVALTEEGKKFVIDEPCVKLINEDLLTKEEKDALKRTAVKKDIIAIAEPTFSEAEMEDHYRAARSKVKRSNVDVLLYHIKIAKIKNIYCPEDFLKAGKSTCRYVYEYYKVTPFGKVLRGISDGDRREEKASFVHYIDTGWRLD